MEQLNEIFLSIDKMFEGAEIDYRELKNSALDSKFFDDYHNQRIVNSFLFNYSKIQDKIGAKLFREVLYAQKEIESKNMLMRDVLNLLEKIGVLNSANEWERVREIRNALAHEYPFGVDERIENLQLAMEGYELIKKVYRKLKEFAG